MLEHRVIVELTSGSSQLRNPADVLPWDDPTNQPPWYDPMGVLSEDSHGKTIYWVISLVFGFFWIYYCLSASVHGPLAV